MLLVGTIGLTKKKSFTFCSADFPFAKPNSSGVMKMAKCRWAQIAQHKIVKMNQTTPLDMVQSTVWRDKNLLGFSTTILLVDNTVDHTVEPWLPWKTRKNSIPSHEMHDLLLLSYESGRSQRQSYIRFDSVAQVKLVKYANLLLASKYGVLDATYTLQSE